MGSERIRCRRCNSRSATRFAAAAHRELHLRHRIRSDPCAPHDRAHRLQPPATRARVAARLARAAAHRRVHRCGLAHRPSHRPLARGAPRTGAPAGQRHPHRVSAAGAAARLHRIARMEPLRRAAVLPRDRDADPDRARGDPHARVRAAPAVPGAGVAAGVGARDRHGDMGPRDPVFPRRPAGDRLDARRISSSRSARSRYRCSRSSPASPSSSSRWW